MDEVGVEGDGPTNSLFQSTLPIAAKLERARTELLDLSARNRLLNMPRSAKAAKIIEIVDERTDEVFRMLVREGRPFTFLPGKGAVDRPSDGDEASKASEPESNGDVVSLVQPEDDALDERGIAVRHADTRLQTRLTSAGLQKRLLDLHHDARVLEDEQGVNILFLALGTLKWVDPNNAEANRFAPLILVPVRLERATAGERFRLRVRPEELSANLSLEAWLDRVHTLKMPTFDAGDDFDPAAYLAAVAEAVKPKADWIVSPDDMVLGFFSFAKFLMYRDLDPELWPADGKIVERPLIRGLMAEGFPEPDGMLPEEASIDDHIPPSRMLHIVDCDGSQTLAVEDVRAGRNLVIQGPPGTGKSQTIANVIAAAIADGKSVLFVAEKMTALDVVKRRLDAAGVGDACLELHSSKASKRIVLDELKRTWALGAPRGDVQTTLVSRLRDRRDDLNAHAARMHAPHPAAGLTPFQVIGQLERLRRRGVKPVEFSLVRPEAWSADDMRLRVELVAELAQRVTDIGLPARHPWWGIGLQAVLPAGVERLMSRIDDLEDRLGGIVDDRTAIALEIEADPAYSFAAFAPVAALAQRLAGAPGLSSRALASDGWDRPQDVRGLVDAGMRLATLQAALKGIAGASARSTPVTGARAVLAGLPRTFPLSGFETVRDLSSSIPRLVAEAATLRTHLGSTLAVGTCAEIATAITMAERVADAPDASPEAFAATVWDRGVDQAGDLAEAVGALETARSALAARIVDVAWDQDLMGARATLATHGTGLMRHLSGDWRRANRLTRSLLVDRAMPLDSLLETLDTLAGGRVARAAVRDGDAFGRAAFGDAWRGERTSAEPLRALVAWMRSLRGLGAEPRLIAGRLPDRSQLAARAARVSIALTTVQRGLEALATDLGVDAGRAFGDEAPTRASLADLASFSSSIADADTICAEVFDAIPADLHSRIAALERMEASQDAAGRLEAGRDLAASVFGQAWRGEASDWASLSSATAWMAANADIRLLASRIPDPAEPARRVIASAKVTDTFLVDFRRLLSDLVTDGASLFGVSAIDAVPTAALGERLRTWRGASEGLSKWVAYRERADKARASGLAEIVVRLETGRLAPTDATATFVMAYHEALYADQARLVPELARFDGDLHERLRRDFADLDLQRIAAASLEVVRAHHRRIPSPNGGAGPVGVLRAEIARRRGHMPIRQLMTKAGPAVQALKPVLMMSPLSVAQFLPPGRLTFDLLVMDEASQIQPVDALGAIARCTNVVVVGDEKQLPPTRFFAKMVGASSDEDEDEDGAQVADIESILGLFSARGLPQRMLRWHYRSRHQSLIAVSNSQFYENRLFIVPSPYTSEAGMGLRFHHVADGVFDSGGTSQNLVEAKTVAAAVIRHARERAKESLGVATFSVAQRKAVMEELEAMRRLSPDTEPFFAAHPGEPFFVKALENVQGDERDVVIISVGYGRNPKGAMAMRFGPLSADGGERRLNVLISRAKRRCEVYASITDEDIDLERGKGRGVAAFKLFLHFARTGRLTLAHTPARAADGVFQIEVAEALQERGLQVHTQVGIAGFFIDIAIADPEKPGRYVLGIECDGVAYRSSRSARDRDRLRQAVLEDHGWIIHRVWSTDWINRPQEQLDRIVAAIDAARVELDARLETAAEAARAVQAEIVTVDRGDEIEIGLEERSEAPSVGDVYEEAAAEGFADRYELHDTPVGLLTASIVKVVAAEGPVHADEVMARLKAAWGIQRAGARIQGHVERCILAARGDGRIEVEDGFLTVPGTRVRVRNRADVASPSLRRPDMLPPSEIRLAILEIARANLGAAPEELVQGSARAFGFRSVSGQLRETLGVQVAALEAEGALERRGDLLVDRSGGTGLRESAGSP